MIYYPSTESDPNQYQWSKKGSLKNSQTLIKSHLTTKLQLEKYTMNTQKFNKYKNQDVKVRKNTIEELYNLMKE